MLTLLGLASIVVNLWIASEALSDTGTATDPDKLIAIGGAMAFAISGFLVGWRSSAHTLWEPALMAIPAALVFPIFFTAEVTTGGLLVASGAAFVITMGAAVLGERV